MNKTLFVIGLFILTGCSTTPTLHTNNNYQNLFNDELFPDADSHQLETQEEIFFLSDEAKAFVDSHTMPTKSANENIDSLAEAIFDRSSLGLTYQASATSTANQTYLSGLANCTSMTIMSYAMAQYAGLDSEFIRVDVPEYWTRQEGFSLLNGHVNLRVYTKGFLDMGRPRSHYTTIDFDPQEVRKHFRSTPISKSQIIAIYYNNRAAESLIQKDFSLAYRYLRAAAELDPLNDDIFVNLGVVYRFLEQYELAEKAYKRASELKPDSFTSVENLAILYRFTNRDAQADTLINRVERARRNNPFYFFILGEEARYREDFTAASTYYRRALRLDKTNHKVLFAMGLTLYEMGNPLAAKRYIGLAARQSQHNDDRERYNGKLAYLTNKLKSPQAL